MLKSPVKLHNGVQRVCNLAAMCLHERLWWANVSPAALSLATIMQLWHLPNVYSWLQTMQSISAKHEAARWNKDTRRPTLIAGFQIKGQQSLFCVLICICMCRTGNQFKFRRLSYEFPGMSLCVTMGIFMFVLHEQMHCIFLTWR